MKPLNRSEIKKFLKKKIVDLDDYPNFELIFLLQSFENATNVGHMFRLADALGVKKLILTGRTKVPPDPEISITSMGQENRINFEYYARVEEAISAVKSEGFTVLSLEVTEKSILYTDYLYPDKVCVLLGNEVKGVYPYSLSKSDAILYLPMFGKNYSLNVHIAGAIVGYEYMKSKSNANK